MLHTSAFRASHSEQAYTSALLLVLLMCSPSLGQSTQMDVNGHELGQRQRRTHKRPAVPRKIQDVRSPINCQLPSKKNNKSRGDFVIAPLPISSPALGSGVIPVGA